MLFDLDLVELIERGSHMMFLCRSVQLKPIELIEELSYRFGQIRCDEFPVPVIGNLFVPQISSTLFGLEVLISELV